MLSFKNISFTLEGKKLFDDASAMIPTGHKVGFVGRNGTGKTTLFRLIRGELALDGGEIETPRRARIGGVAQEAPATRDSLVDTVLEADTERAALLAEADTATAATRIAEIQTRLADIEAHSAEARAAAILHGLGFDAAAQARPCADFSGGWRMRVALAGVLFAQPDYLLLDEPTASLDPAHQLRIMDLMERLRQQEQITIVMVSHDLNLASAYADRLMLLKDGVVEKIGTPRQVLTRGQLTHSYGCNLIVDDDPILGTPRVSLVSEKAGAALGGVRR